MKTNYYEGVYNDCRWSKIYIVELEQRVEDLLNLVSSLNISCRNRNDLISYQSEQIDTLNERLDKEHELLVVKISVENGTHIDRFLNETEELRKQYEMNLWIENNSTPLPDYEI